MCLMQRLCISNTETWFSDICLGSAGIMNLRKSSRKKPFFRR